jgi:hypothetical protein
LKKKFVSDGGKGDRGGASVEKRISRCGGRCAAFGRNDVCSRFAEKEQETARAKTKGKSPSPSTALRVRRTTKRQREKTKGGGEATTEAQRTLSPFNLGSEGKKEERRTSLLLVVKADWMVS